MSDWILLKEELPPSGELVLVSTPYIVTIGKYSEATDSFSDDIGIPLNMVQAWQYLPEPYEEEDVDDEYISIEDVVKFATGESVNEN